MLAGTGAFTQTARPEFNVLGPDNFGRLVPEKMFPPRSLEGTQPRNMPPVFVLAQSHAGLSFLEGNNKTHSWPNSVS